MRTLYLECNMGAAGDMLTAALLELVPDRQAFLNKMNSLGLPGVRVEAEKAQMRHHGHPSEGDGGRRGGGIRRHSQP